MARALAAVAGEVPDKARVQRALLSVSDKKGVVELAQFLQKRSVEPLEHRRAFPSTRAFPK
jgi:hypothetical protein